MALFDDPQTDLWDSFPPKHEVLAATLLKTSLRRRDNLLDFVHGLVETEVFPYPDGQRDIVAATYVPVQEVTWRPGALHELTTLFIRNVEHKVDGAKKHVSVTITLTPDDGVGTYELDYEIKGEVGPTTLMSKRDVESVRMAMWARYEWVKDKIEYINQLRLAAAHKSDHGDENGNADSSDWDSNLSEDADPYDTEDESVTSDGPYDAPFVDDATNDPAEFPDAECLRAIDISLLRQIFQRGELESLHNTIKVHRDSFKLPTAILDGVGTSGHENRTKRKVLEDDMADAQKRIRTEMVENVRSSFFDLAKSLPGIDSTGEELRAFRANAGSLHLTSRLLELDENLKDSDMDRCVSKRKNPESHRSGNGVSSIPGNEPHDGIAIGAGSPVLVTETTPDPRYSKLSSDILEGLLATGLLQSQYVETQIKGGDDEFSLNFEGP